MITLPPLEPHVVQANPKGGLQHGMFFRRAYDGALCQVLCVSTVYCEIGGRDAEVYQYILAYIYEAEVIRWRDAMLPSDLLRDMLDSNDEFIYLGERFDAPTPMIASHFAN